MIAHLRKVIDKLSVSQLNTYSDAIEMLEWLENEIKRIPKF